MRGGGHSYLPGIWYLDEYYNTGFNTYTRNLTKIQAQTVSMIVQIGHSSSWLQIAVFLITQGKVAFPIFKHYLYYAEF